MRTIYRVIQRVHTLEGETYRSYGIGCGESEIPDVCCDRAKIEKLAGLCNQLELDPLHLSDVVEDFLAEESTYR